MLNTNLTITQARAKLLGLSQKLHKDQAVTVTKRGKPVLAIVPWDLYESIVETLEVMADADLMAMLRQSLKEAESGKRIPWEKVKKELPH
ncbi:MAG: type II toxin-antitoxin system prevent-host-death family antitoxin [Elusimicrobia bacterium]|nr:type II toxin-antitoxin system prevent-host-death family antitoxin [Elusimicrobiota bacterium]